MSDRTSDLAFRRESIRRPRREGNAWEAVVREELVKLRRRSPGGPRVQSLRPRTAPDVPEAPPPAAA